MSNAPQPAVPVLGYAGPTVPQRAAFNARRTWAWKGEHLFRVYLTPTHLCFVRIGGARNNAMAYQGGLLGALIAMWVNKRAKKKEAERVLQNEEKPLEQLLAEHKRNHTIALAEMSDVAIENAGFWGGNGCRLCFKHVGEKKPVRIQFDTNDDVEAAIRNLQPVVPGLRVGVQFDEKKKKYIKVK